MNNLFEESFLKLLNYCEAESFKGWDPFDGLNSWVVQKTPLGKSRFFRLAWIQLFKRSPLNLRRLFGVKKGYNPKGLALFLIGYCNLYNRSQNPAYRAKIDALSQQLFDLQCKGYSGACWGYNFDWQARAFFQPKNTPTVVATSFVVEALLMAYQLNKNKELLATAVSATKFILNDLNRTKDGKGDYTLSYSPLDHTQVYNAGLLGAKALCLVYTHNNNKKLLEESKKIVSYVCNRQSSDGSWAYGSLPYHQWIDSFHTGYNLECIALYQKVSADQSYSSCLSKGLKYYTENFFTSEGVPKYYNNKTFPIDIHAPAQLLVTLVKTASIKDHDVLAHKVLRWTIQNMQSKKGYYYYQKIPLLTYRIPYIRWAQSWMFYALSYYLLNASNEKDSHIKH
jgi:rhamnogalacturonyl hydrolase YesR